MRMLILPAVALVAVAIANIDIEPTRTVTKVVHAPAQVKTVYKTREVKVPVKTTPDGYISRRECVLLEDGTTIEEIINRFGWPRGEPTDDSFYDVYMNITLREDHTSFCSIDFVEDEITKVQVL